MAHRCRPHAQRTTTLASSNVGGISRDYDDNDNNTDNMNAAAPHGLHPLAQPPSRIGATTDLRAEKVSPAGARRHRKQPDQHQQLRGHPPTGPTSHHNQRLPSKAHAFIEGDADTIFVVRRRHVVQLPHSFRLTPGSDVLLRLCREYCMSQPATCTRGLACPCVHAQLFLAGAAAATTDETPRFTRHVAPANGGAWGSVSEIPYPWVFLKQLPPLCDPRQDDDHRHAEDAPVATVALRTRATDEEKGAAPEQLEPCSHWLRAGVCHFGAMCKYMHVAHVHHNNARTASAAGIATTTTTTTRRRRRYPFAHNPYQRGEWRRAAAATVATEATKNQE
jgi:hypothetical protein